MYKICAGPRRAIVILLLVAPVIFVVYFSWRYPRVAVFDFPVGGRHSVTPGPPSPGLSTAQTPTLDPFRATREHVVKSQIEPRGVKDERVLQAMANVPRHEFVPPEYTDQAYEDHPLPIHRSQTISQPYIVAVMTELLRLEPDSRVLEIGTGSGYQAAVLAELAREVYSVEIIPELCNEAESRLAGLGYTNVQVMCGDGYYGWEEHAPYDAIVVTCAPDHLPQPLVEQLADGGRMVIPVGPPGAFQALWLVERLGEQIKARRMMEVTFVPLAGAH